ncbi:heavy metal-responsive transcriptional regulator [Arthrobacter cryoconiti]|uniref:Heavy metal-responsive transcriptional regulator n=1 Tax=Arthrobacter cryoconiti TaxID=748907 RepID=A0ABV8R7E8_9MICC|nr:heavy metal-responsive transcriptional regulator [Arthrobacter cryoconiti]MCC9069437.1 heavy metal-responsive transcriptional regulator [Arthrobacter cryoconiti]
MRIGQLAEAAGTTTKTLRFYEDSGLLLPAERLASGYRNYAEDAVGRVGFIHRGQAAGLTLAQIGQILKIREHGQVPCSHVKGLLGERLRELDAQITELLVLRETISQLHEKASEPEPDSCSAEQVCRYL